MREASRSLYCRFSQPWIEQARQQYQSEQQKQRLFTDFHYKAGTWNRRRRVILEAEHMSQGSNPRYVVTNLDGDAQSLYEQLYCARGEMENRIKEQQLDLFADRTSCSLWWPNQFRLLLSTLAFTLIHAIRRIALKNTELATATCATIRLTRKKGSAKEGKKGSGLAIKQHEKEEKCKMKDLTPLFLSSSPA